MTETTALQRAAAEWQSGKTPELAERIRIFALTNPVARAEVEKAAPKLSEAIAEAIVYQQTKPPAKPETLT